MMSRGFRKKSGGMGDSCREHDEGEGILLSGCHTIS